MVYTIPIRSTHNSIFIAYDHACTLCFGYSCFEMAELDVEQLLELLNLLMVLMAQKDLYGSILSLNWMAVDKLLMRILWCVFCAHVMRRELHTARHPQI